MTTETALSAILEERLARGSHATACGCDDARHAANWVIVLFLDEPQVRELLRKVTAS